MLWPKNEQETFGVLPSPRTFIKLLRYLFEKYLQKVDCNFACYYMQQHGISSFVFS